MKSAFLATAVALGVFLLGVHRSDAADAGGPHYVVEPCCQLCPQTADRQLYATPLLQPHTVLAQGRDGWLYRTDDDLRTSFDADDPGLADLKRFRDALAARGIELVLVYQPPRGLVQASTLPTELRKQYNEQLARFSYGATLQHFRALGITVPPLDRLANERDGRAYFFRGDHHWTPDGARRTAHLVAEAIKAMPAFKDIPRQHFVTERTKNWGKLGTLQRAATQLCGFGYANQYVPRYVTTSADGGDLLNDAPIPKITLVGTSNSDSPYNFGGFLAEELGADVLDEASPGGGHEGALQQYLPSDAFQKHPPKILVWELETFHNLSKLLFYRQVIPMISNGCATRPAVISRTVQLKPTSTEALFNGGGKVIPLKSRDHIVDVTFSDPNVREFRANLWYSNGSKEQINIEHSAYVDTQGRFVFELRDDPEWADRMFLSMDVATPQGAAPGTTLTSTVCAREYVTPPQPHRTPAPPGHKKAPPIPPPPV